MVVDFEECQERWINAVHCEFCLTDQRQQKYWTVSQKIKKAEKEKNKKTKFLLNESN